MKFRETAIAGVWLIEPERQGDDRGWFARTYCAEVFAGHGLNTHWPQSNASMSQDAGTLRGLHWQGDPHGEVKLVRCTRGALFDVAVDVRRCSPSFGRWAGVMLSAENGHQIYLPTGIAHGFQTLASDTEIFYQMGAAHMPDAAMGIRPDDPDIGIQWPLPIAAMSPRDRGMPPWRAMVAKLAGEIAGSC